MKPYIALSLLCIMFGWSVYGIAQPNLEDPIVLQFLPSGYRITTAISDGYGQHVVAVASSPPQKYYLLGNNGSIIYGPVDFSSASAGHFQAAITRHAEKITIVMTDYISVFAGEIHLYQSTNGGQSWPVQPEVYFTPTNTSINRIDAFGDDNSVHIVWDDASSPEVHYVRFDEPSGDFQDHQTVTDLSGITGFGPKVTKLNNRIIVSFVRSLSVAEDNFGASRDRVLDATPYWEGFLHEAELIDDDDIGTQSTAVFNNEIHMNLVETGEGGVSGDDDIFASSRQLTGDWSTLDNFAVFDIADEGSNHSRKIASNGASLFSTNAIKNGNPAAYEIRLWNYDIQSGWSTYDVVQPSSSTEHKWPTISSSKTGAYVFWTTGDYLTRTMRRKVQTINGSITENMFWTGNNWLTGDTYIENGYTVTMKGGSVGSTTTIQAGKKLYVRAGGKLVVENGAQLVMEAGARIILESGAPTAGILELKDNAVLTIPSGAFLEANPGTQIKSGLSAKLEIKGQLKSLGTGTSSSQQVLFTRTGTSGTWTGISVENSSGGQKATITYTKIEHCNTAVRVGINGSLLMNNSIVDDTNIGVEFVSAFGAVQFSGITSSTFTNIISTGVLVTDISSLTIDGNTITPTASTGSASTGIRCINSSPKLLHNSISDFPTGVRCLSGSSPSFEDVSAGGFNSIKDNGIGVYCKDYSDPLLGSAALFGGQNCISGSGTYDLQLVDNCDVIARSNWWGEYPPEPLEFSVVGGSTLDRASPLTLCPPGGLGMGGRGGGDPHLSLIPLDLLDALDVYLHGDVAEAISLFQDVLENNRNSQSVREWATSMLLACGQKSDSSIASYLERTRDNYPEFARLVNFILPHVYLDENRVADATALFDANILNYPSSELERDALYGKFLNSLYAERDTSDAGVRLEDLETRYAESDEAYIAREQFETFTNSLARSSFGKDQGQTTSVSALPDDFSLGQNYPNPFNPVTTIQYSLPADVHVSLIVYDVLGREVVRLVDGIVERGSHEVTLDAKNLSSGLYFYRLSAGSFADVKKLLLMK